MRAGVGKVLDRKDKDEEYKVEYRSDMRFRKMKLSLRNLDNFTKHYENTVYTYSQFKVINAIEILDEC